MSMHKIPLTDVEREGLTAHGLDIGTPSQLSDAFRQGVAWAQKNVPIATAKEEAAESFTEAVTPAIKWIAENCHPHTQIVIDSTSAILWEGQKVHNTEEFLRG